MVQYDKEKAHLISLPWFLLLFLFPFHWTLLNLFWWYIYKHNSVYHSVKQNWNRWRRSGYSINSPSINPQLLLCKNIWENWINSTDDYKKDVSLTENNVFFINNWPSKHVTTILREIGWSENFHDDLYFLHWIFMWTFWNNIKINILFLKDDKIASTFSVLIKNRPF